MSSSAGLINLRKASVEAMDPTEAATAAMTTSRPPRKDLPPELANVTDEQISAYTQEIHDSFTRDTPLIGPYLPISDLLDECRNNEPFVRKLSSLAKKWNGFRRTQRNGNCFYLAFAHAWLEGLERIGQRAIETTIAKVEESTSTFESAGKTISSVMLIAGFDKLGFEDFSDAMLEVLRSLPLGPKLVETLKYLLTSLCLVFLMRAMWKSLPLWLSISGFFHPVTSV
jgi:hypothetical protein